MPVQDIDVPCDSDEDIAYRGQPPPWALPCSHPSLPPSFHWIHFRDNDIRPHAPGRKASPFPHQPYPATTKFLPAKRWLVRRKILIDGRLACAVAIVEKVLGVKHRSPQLWDTSAPCLGHGSETDYASCGLLSPAEGPSLPFPESGCGGWKPNLPHRPWSEWGSWARNCLEVLIIGGAVFASHSVGCDAVNLAQSSCHIVLGA